MKTRYSIGEMSRLFEIPVSTLRHYHNKGIFVAEYTDEESGYRYYSADQFELLNNIINLRYGKVPLERIREFTSKGDIDSLEEALEEQEKDLRRKIEELEGAKRSIEDRLGYIKGIKGIEEFDRVLIEERDEEVTFTIRDEFQSEEELELLVKRLGKESAFSYSLVLGNVGLLMKRGKDYKTYAGVYLKNKGMKSSQGNEVRKKGRYLVIYFEGTREDSKGYYKAIEEYAAEMSVEVEDEFYEMALLSKKGEGYIRRIEVKIK